MDATARTFSRFQSVGPRAPIYSPGPLIKGQDDPADMHREFVV